MNKALSVLIITLITLNVAFSQDKSFSQEKSLSQNRAFIKANNRSFERNEIRVNLLSSVIGFPEFNYERFLESNFGLGVAGSLYLVEETNIRSMLIPYGRLYFGEKVCAGFFIEGNLGLITEKMYPSTITTNLGIGVAIGYKFLTINNWVGDIHLGVGRIYGGSQVEAYPRIGVSLGKRF